MMFRSNLYCNTLLFVIFFLLVCYIVFKFCFRYLSWFLYTRKEIKLRIGGLRPFSVQQIYVQLKNGNTLEIDKIWLSSNLLISKHRSLLVLCINDIRLQGDAEWIKSHTNQDHSSMRRTNSGMFSSRLSSFLKVFSIKILNASIMQLRTPQREFLLHASVQELNVFSNSIPDGILINVSSESLAIKVFKHLPLSSGEQRSDSCLAHLGTNIDISVEIIPSSPQLYKAICIKIMQPELMLYEGISISKLKQQVSSGLHPSNSERLPHSIQLVDNVPKQEVLNQQHKEKKIPENSRIYRILEKIPQMAKAMIESFSIKLVKEGGYRAFTMDVKSLELQTERDCSTENKTPLIKSLLFIRNAHVASGHTQFAQLIEASAKIELQDNMIDSHIGLTSFNMFYDSSFLQYWLGILPQIPSKKVSHTRYGNLKPQSLFWAFIKGHHIKHNTEMNDICISAKLTEGMSFSVGMAHAKCTAESILSLTENESKIQQKSASLADISVELLLETAYFNLGQGRLPECSTMRRNHFWNMPLSIGLILLKGRFHPLDYSIECMTDIIQIEWSPTLSSLLQMFISFFKRKNCIESEISDTTNGDISEDNEVKKVEPFFPALSLQLNFAGVNVFALSETITGFVLRIDAFNINSNPEQMHLVFEGTKVTQVSPSAQPYHCTKAADMKKFVAHLPYVQVVNHIKNQQVSLRMSNDISALWSSTFHMTSLSVVQEIYAFLEFVLMKEDNLLPKTNRRQSLVSLLINVEGNINLALELSGDHEMTFVSSEVIASVNQLQKTLQTPSFCVLLDGHKIFSLQQFAVCLADGTEQHMLNRLSFDDITQPNNKLLNVDMDEFKVFFPFQYNFAEVFNEQFMNTVKWLKLVHKMKKSAFTSLSPLPADVCIRVKVFTIEIEDDPFEVKLRDNFELLEDEYQESLKRKRILDEKIESFQRTKLLVPGEKISELYSKLEKKNTEIYIQRSKQMYESGPPRTSLLTWHFENVEILAICDPSYHGTEKVVEKMKLVNSESPFLEDCSEFSTLWCRKIRCSMRSWNCHLRDFPQPLLQVRELHVWGLLIGAEQEALQRAKRTSVVHVGKPWGDMAIERSMPSLKFYYDLTFDMEDMCISYGPCWEPLLAQYSLSMELISRPSLDPSPPLPWWDKVRLLLHGRLTWSVQHLTSLLRASLDPYNTTEQMEISWSDVIIEWTNGKILTKGDLDMYVHTASKYDDCRVLHIPNLKLSINLDWLCLGNPNDHHNVMPCAPDKVPEYSINQEHDSYRAFRSQNLNLLISFETRLVNVEMCEVPSMLLYSSTLRWIENLKMILSGVTRLTRRGKLFSNTRLRKPQLSRHYRNLRISLNLHKFQICYWMSFAKQRGLELLGGRLSLSSEHTQTLTQVIDGLKHRPKSNWSIGYLNCELCDSEMWLYNCMQMYTDEKSNSFHIPVDRSYFLSVNCVSYGREEIMKDVISEEDRADTPTHRLVVHGLKGAWTKHNRTVVFSLFDSYMRTVILKRNLSTDALRCFKVETQNTPQKLRSQTNASQNSIQATPSPVSHLQSSHAASMLQKLIADTEANPMVFTEEIDGTAREQQLHGVAACQTDDVLQKNWLIELVNSQVMLKGCETSGYVIVSAAKAQILQRIHRPVWKDRSLVSKTTWVGSLECMQYYATVDVGEPSPSIDNVIWLSVDNIEERESMIINDLPDLVGSGQSVGGVVSNTVGAASDPNSAPIQLQRIVSRCGCQFFYASFGENIDPSSLEEVPPLPEDIGLWDQEVAVDSFTLTHHDLDMCTNSLQYAMILDLVNNLLLYVEPRKKEAIEKLQYMRFQLQLCSVDDQKEPILQLQENVRYLVSKLRRLEKRSYTVHRILCENPEKEEYVEELEQLDIQMFELKEQLNTMNEELATMISCFKETQIIASKSRQRATSQEKGVTVARRSEVCFKHAQWRLTDADGQLGIADLVLSNFLYSKVTKNDDSVEHLLELGYVKMTNLLPNQLYKHVLQPTDVQTKIPLDRQRLLRIYCRERAPVGGISIKEHVEVNVIPITIGLTDAFYKTMLKFFFPGRDTEKADDHRYEDHEGSSMNSKKHPAHSHQKSSSTFYGDREDIEKMKERADKNHTFLYIKIPEVPLRISYKGKKDKNIEDVHDLSLVLSTLEFHNRTWTWLDLLMELKNDAKKILLSQAIKQRLLKSNRSDPEKDNQPQEDEKARILFGPKHMGAADRNSKRRFF